VGVFSTASDSASITAIVKIAAFDIYLQLGKQRQVRWVGDDSHVVFGKEIPWLKRKRETVLCHDATASYLSPKFRAKSLNIFMQSS
jgi:hypothetical protein